MARGQRTRRSGGAGRAALRRRGGQAAAAAAERSDADEKKARKEARISKRVADAHDRIDAGIAQMREAEGFRAYLRSLAAFHTYSANNNILIHMQMPDATKVASETAWRKLGRTVTHDASRHPIRILTPRSGVRTEVDEETGEERKVRFVIPGRFGTANVYDISQTEGDDLPEAVVDQELTGSSDEAEDMVVRVARWCQKEGIAYGAENDVDGGSRYDARAERITIDRARDHNQRALLFVSEATRAALVRDPELHNSLSEAERRLVVSGTAYAVAHGCGLDAGEATFPTMATIADDRRSVDRSLKAVRELTHRILGD